MRHKLNDWIQRYLPAEISGTIGALVTAEVVFSSTNSLAIAVIAGTWGENIGYYTLIVWADLYTYRQRNRHRRVSFWTALFTQLRNMLIEFGPAEAFDTVLIRPAAMYLAYRWIGSFSLGILIGKLASDVVFYLPTIAGYELRKKLFNS